MAYSPYIYCAVSYGRHMSLSNSFCDWHRARTIQRYCCWRTMG
jgi:hypothetical protein